MLDVYKRQQDTLVRVALMATHTKEQVDYAVDKLTKCFKKLETVSYTHLDVYKRQEHFRKEEKYNKNNYRGFSMESAVFFAIWYFID